METKWRTYRFVYRDRTYLLKDRFNSQEISTRNESIKPEDLFRRWAMKTCDHHSLLEIVSFEEVKLNKNHERCIR